jgi:ankyrin repeat protein
MVPIFIFAFPKYTVVTFCSQNTSLSLAAMYGHVEVCKLLFAANADLSLRSRLRLYVTHSRSSTLNRTHGHCRSGKTALQFAIENGKSGVAEYLRSIQAPL